MIKSHFKFLWTLLKHKWFVLVAGFKVGKIPLRMLLAHDLSKFSPKEFPHYARSFCGKADDPVGFAYAWVHHQNNNPHHWEYYIPRTCHVLQKTSDWTPNTPLPMPEVYVREMVADWMGASKAYQGHWNIDDWLSKHRPNMRLHPETDKILDGILVEIILQRIP